MNWRSSYEASANEASATYSRAVRCAAYGRGNGGVSQAHTLTLTPFASPTSGSTWGVTDTSNLSQSQVESLVGVSPLGLVYKQDQGGAESGNGAGYYTTAFTYESVGDATSAMISWDGGMKISCPSCFLIVKDGNHDASNPPPYPQYVYDISGWNGTDTINLSGFWLGQGSISNIAIWNSADEGGGGSVVAIPEPATYAMLLAGLGLVGFAARRKLS